MIQDIVSAGALQGSIRFSPVMGRVVPQNPLTGGNAYLEQILRLQGFDGLPLLGDEMEVQEAVTQRKLQAQLAGVLLTNEPEDLAAMKRYGGAGSLPLYRYLWEPPDNPSPTLENAKRYAEQFRSGPFFAGLANRYGAGGYFIPYQGVLEGQHAVILQAAFRPEANVVLFDDLAHRMRQDGLNPAIPSGDDPGYYAACQGVDAYFLGDDVAENLYYVILNRTSLIVSQRDILPRL